MPIFDQGYQHWSGPISGHAWRWLAITRRGVRNASTNRMLRIVLFAAWLPAIVLAFVLCMWGLLERQSDLVEAAKPVLSTLLGVPIPAGPREYRTEVWTIAFDYFLQCELWFSVALVLLVGPDLISQDLRYNAMPLYFSRPLRRIDYFLGKLGVIAALLGMVIVVPSVVAYLLGLIFSLDITIVKDTFGVLLAAITYGLVIATSMGLLILAISSLSRNSRYVALFWIGILVVTPIVSLALVNIDREQHMHEAGRRPRDWMTEDNLKDQIAAAKSDWRPLLSYTGNLSRVQAYLLGTNESWEQLGELLPAGQRSSIMAKILGAQSPWYWSMAVLIGLMGLSVCILNFSIKSLDRLK